MAIVSKKISTRIFSSHLFSNGRCLTDIFVAEKTVWKQEATIFIDSVVAFLTDSPFYWLEVRASPDQKNPSKHSRLGMAREQAICDYMITRGVSPDQVVPMGYGNSLPQPPVSKNSNNDETQDRIVFCNNW